MWEKIRVVFTIPELRKKILFTLGLLAVYRVGWQIPLPIIDQAQMTEYFKATSGMGALLSQVAVFSAAKLTTITIFGLGIMPYISASIIFQLLGSVWGPLERLQKEGESGRKKINEYTRYATVVLCIGQSWFYLGFLISSGLVLDSFLVDGHLSIFWQITTVMTMTAGTIFLMWLGEQIDEFGIGNGISLIIMAGILAGMPGAAVDLLSQSSLELGSGSGKLGLEVLLLLVVLFVAVVAGVVFITLGQRRIPTQSAKHVRGRRVYGGTRQYLPLRVNQAGVMPIIFASSLLMFPSLLFSQLARIFPNTVLTGLSDAFVRGTSFTYNVLYVVLIYFFCYFWTAITFNPKDMSENLKSFGTFIPGYRPGKRTADYLEKVMVRITYVGAGFLALVAITPTVVAGIFSVDPGVASFFGGTGLLIAVSVAFDLVQKIDSHLVMRNYRGLLEKG
ncbi:MAG: preprotein translocase subunit SecY [Pirellulales bacterium]